MEGRSSHVPGKAYGPFQSLNPTTRRISLPLKTEEKASSQGELKESNGQSTTDSSTQKDELRAEGVEGKWTSRNNRKERRPHENMPKYRVAQRGALEFAFGAPSRDGTSITTVFYIIYDVLNASRTGRHAIVVAPATDQNTKYYTPPSSSTLKQTLKGIWRMLSTSPYWDVSYLVAIVFTWGSIIWCINAFFVWLPLQVPSSEFDGEITSGGGITAFIGATVFEIGSVLLMMEALNENRSDCFGWALEDVLEEAGVVRLKPGHCIHHHQNDGNLVGKGKHTTENKDSEHQTPSSSRTWIWFPSWHDLKTHYLNQIGFLACLSQMIGATIFWIAGFTALPPIYDRLTSTAAQNGAYWLPQVVGGTGFIVSGTLFMLETQKKWYLPAPKVLGWHIGLWNLIGGIGFTLCGALGFGSANSGCVYQGSLATFWGSWCFLIGSVIQWYESLAKHPVEVEEIK